MIRRLRLVATALVAIVLAIPLLPGPGILIIMAAFADIEQACSREFGRRPAAGFSPRISTEASRKSLKRPVDHDLSAGRRVA